MTTFTTQDRQAAQRTPLTMEQIMQLYNPEYSYIEAEVILFARAIERAHGIGE